jgi:hypothetical protein
MSDTGPTKTLAEWMDYEKTEAAKPATDEPEATAPSEPISDEQAAKFMHHYGVGAEQKMDRATLDARMKALKDLPDPEPPQPAAAPSA